MSPGQITMRLALQRIERMTRGFYWLSANGLIHALAAAALKMPLTDDERKLLEAERNL
jgi:hypothetical protein